MKLKFLNRLTITCIAAVLFGCASLDFQVTEFKPKNSTNEYQIYEYKAFADAVYPHDSEKAEKIRIEWLERWLENNNHTTDNYEILSRNEIMRSTGALGALYDIYYEVRVKKLP